MLTEIYARRFWNVLFDYGAGLCITLKKTVILSGELYARQGEESPPNEMRQLKVKSRSDEMENTIGVICDW